MKYLIPILLIFTILICIILPIFNIFFFKTFTFISFFISILLLFINKRNKKKITLIILIALNVIYILDNGVFYSINSKPIYTDKNIIVVKKNKFWEFLACGATFLVYEKKKFTFTGREIISSKMCQKENPKILFIEEDSCYDFYVDNLYNTKVKRYYIDE